MVNYQELRFQSFVDVPRCSCQIGTARDSQNHVHIFLIVKHNGPIYRRSGLKDNWEDLGGEGEVIRQIVSRSTAPRYTTENHATLN